MTQSLGIMNEKLTERAEANLHPFVLSQPVAFSEEMLSQFDWSPTARIYLQAYKLVKEGLEILRKSDFTDERGITLIAHGYLTENSILQAIPAIKGGILSPLILNCCEKKLFKNRCFFEGLLLSIALRTYASEGKVSAKSCKVDTKTLMCIKNLIKFIQKAEPNSLPSEDPFKFDKNYSSWLHVLYYHMAAIYTIREATEEAAKAFENSLICCPSYFESKRGLGYSLMELYFSKQFSAKKDYRQDEPTEMFRAEKRKAPGKDISKYASWTAEELRDTAVKTLKEFLLEAPSCYKTYPNVFYYLAKLAGDNMQEFKEYYELGQDAEQKRLSFFGPFNLPLKDLMTPYYQLFSNVQKPVRCGNKACSKEVKESDLKSCGGCVNQKYCSK